MTPSLAKQAEAIWKAEHFGKCPMCSKHQRLLNHHVIYLQHVKRECGDEYDLRNALPLGMFGCLCHSNHHAGAKRIPLRLLPDSAFEFGIELMGGPRTASYLERRYAGADPRIDRLEGA